MEHFGWRGRRFAPGRIPESRGKTSTECGESRAGLLIPMNRNPCITMYKNNKCESVESGCGLSDLSHTEATKTEIMRHDIGLSKDGRRMSEIFS